MKDKYYEVQISFNKANYDQLYNELYVNGIENILEEEGLLKIYFEGNKKRKINSLKDSLIKRNRKARKRIQWKIYKRNTFAY